MRYFTARGEDRRLDGEERRRLRGGFVALSDGVTHYELTVPLFYWDGLAARLHARGLRTLAYSGYGRGYSDRVRGVYDEELFVRQLAELIGSLGLGRPLHLAGTLLDLLLRSDRLAGFVAQRFGRRLLEGHLGHNVRDPRQAACLAEMVIGAYRYEGSMFAFFDTLQHFPLTGRADLFARTSQTGVPTLLLWGSDDLVTPIDRMREARALLKPAQCHRIEESGHMAPFERPGEVAAFLAPFTQNHPERPGS